MEAEVVDVAELLSGRKKRHIFLRGLAKFLDLIVIGLVLRMIDSFIPNIGSGLQLCLLVFYFFVSESLFGFTLGKLICGLRVVGLDGRAPTGFRCLVRNAIRPFEAFGLLGIILVACSNRGQRLGDLAAETFVVRTGELENLAHNKQALATNLALSCRRVVSISPNALDLARTGIAASTRPADTGLSVAECRGVPHGLTVQFDRLETDDSMWQWTTDGVTISVPKEIAERCGDLMIDVHDGKFVVVPA